MKYVFSAIGGSGSTHLVKTLSEKYVIGHKPDTVFRPLLEDLRIDTLNSEQGSLAERAPGFSLIQDETIDAFLIRYIAYIRSSEKRTAVFNTCAELGLFSRHEISDVIFLVRHPLHAYVSWAKPERHGNIIDYLGGINSRTAVHFYAKRWNAVIKELLTLKEKNILGGVIRYEFASTDSQNILEISWAFEDFDGTKRNHGMLAEEGSRYLRQETFDLFSKVYPDWDI